MGHLPANYKNTGGLYHLVRPRFAANSAAILAKFMFLYLYAYAKYALNKLNLLLNTITGQKYFHNDIFPYVFHIKLLILKTFS